MNHGISICPFNLLKFSECFAVEGIMKLQDYVWKDEKKGIERGKFEANVDQFATGK
jgi:hypothetical protein